jgi:transglutaminase-like putative cysteine protease
MYFEITHKTTYRYNRPVFLEAHTLRLRPRCDGLQNLTQFHWKVEPRPAGSSDATDLDGNVTANVWFQGLSNSFVVKSRATIFTRERNPFNYILADRADRLPVIYMDPIRAYVAPYTARCSESHFVEQFARQIANQTEWKTLRFLTALNREIYECCQQIARLPGAAQTAEETLLRKHGSARDLAVLFIDTCRYVGIAARFVNGYRENRDGAGKQYLHSWGEVFLPGAGWRGYDPSEGLAISDRHIALAAAGDPLLAGPVVGTFRGNAVDTELSVEIDVRTVAGDEMESAACSDRRAI